MNWERFHDPPPTQERLGGSPFLHELLHLEADFHVAMKQRFTFKRASLSSERAGDG